MPRGWIATGLIGMVACSSSQPAESRGGSLQVEWIGSDTGQLSAPAIAEWCDSLGLLELRAIHGDTGIALVLYPSDSGPQAGTTPSPGDYPVVIPQRADSARPAAAIALRWFAETSIRGFRGDTGSVALEATGPGAVAGKFSAALRSATEGSRLTITGSFKGLTIAPAPPECAGRAVPQQEEPTEPMDEEDDDFGIGSDTV
ncbi:MAG: hypothetical protein ACREM9_05180 [Gemmatimonadales bacterium]